jgi:hypothetical protein
MPKGSTRLNSRLEAEGAEFLVLANLLIEGIYTTKAYTRYPGYDLVAADPNNGTSCRIQVKSRWATDYDGGFPIKKLDCDFVVFVALNRGYRYKKSLQNSGDNGKRSPSLYVFPAGVLTVMQSGGWSKAYLRDIEDVTQYQDRWDLIRDHLKGTRAPDGKPSQMSSNSIDQL